MFFKSLKRTDYTTLKNESSLYSICSSTSSSDYFFSSPSPSPFSFSAPYSVGFSPSLFLFLLVLLSSSTVSGLILGLRSCTLIKLMILKRLEYSLASMLRT